MGVPTWCNEAVDEFERQCVSDKDLADMVSKERSIMRCLPSIEAPTAVRELAMPPGHLLFVAQVLDTSGFWVTWHDFQLQVVAATAALYMCVKLHDNPLERIGTDGQLLTFVDGATSFLDRASNE